jgi:hypothetical protein
MRKTWVCDIGRVFDVEGGRYREERRGVKMVNGFVKFEGCNCNLCHSSGFFYWELRMNQCKVEEEALRFRLLSSFCLKQYRISRF